MTKMLKIESLFVVVRFLSPSSLKRKFTIILKKHTDFELLHLQNPYFYFFCKCVKKAQRHKKKLKTKTRYEISTVKLVKNSKKNLYKKLVQEIFFFFRICFFGTSAVQNTTHSLQKDFFSHRNPFDNCLIVKNWNPKK